MFTRDEQLERDAITLDNKNVTIKDYPLPASFPFEHNQNTWAKIEHSRVCTLLVLHDK